MAKLEIEKCLIKPFYRVSMMKSYIYLLYILLGRLPTFGSRPKNDTNSIKLCLSFSQSLKFQVV